MAAAWSAAGVIILLNGLLVFGEIRHWIESAGELGWLVGLVAVPLALALSGLLAWLVFRRERVTVAGPPVSAEDVVRTASGLERRLRRIGVALDASPSDAAMLAEAIALARTHKADLVLMHVVEGAGSQWYGEQTGDRERRQDETYLAELVERLRRELAQHEVPQVQAALGYGNTAPELVSLCRAQQVDFLVLGGHGHRGLWDWFYGETIPGVRHGLPIPILTVRG
jgi:manganese transport protein